MDVSIIIVSYNVCDLLCQCISSIYDKVTDVSFEVIVVDNASSDNSVDKIKQTFPNVKVIASPLVFLKPLLTANETLTTFLPSGKVTKSGSFETLPTNIK